MKHIKLFEQYIVERSSYDSLARKLTGESIKKWVSDFAIGQKKSSFYEQVELKGLEFDLECSIHFEGNGFTILDSTGADARDIDDEGDDQTPYIIIDFACNPEWLPGYWNEIYNYLIDTMRHEIEHITQGGEGVGNYRPGKPNKDDSDMRLLIKNGILPQHFYLLLPKEVDANIQGLRREAKTRREPMVNTVNRYLDTQTYLTDDTRQEVLDTWRQRAKVIGGIPNF